MLFPFKKRGNGNSALVTGRRELRSEVQVQGVPEQNCDDVCAPVQRDLALHSREDARGRRCSERHSVPQPEPSLPPRAAPLTTAPITCTGRSVATVRCCRLALSLHCTCSSVNYRSKITGKNHLRKLQTAKLESATHQALCG